MISDILLILGVAVISSALRSFHHPLLFRIGTLGILTTSFLAGWLLGGSLALGIVFAATWLFLPWIEILTRIRHLRLPLERALKPRTPPNRNDFPGLGELTEQIEEAGFEHVADMGWDFEDNRHFYRVFGNPGRRAQACICLNEQHDISFYYLSVTSRAADGSVFMTWNYPFSFGLKPPPQLHLKRFAGPHPFEDLLTAHESFVEKEAPADLVAPGNGDEIIAALQSDLRTQILHNINAGLIRREDGQFIRYTARGMFYLWCQFLRDLVRIS